MSDVVATWMPTVGSRVRLAPSRKARPPETPSVVGVVKEVFGTRHCWCNVHWETPKPSSSWYLKDELEPASEGR